MKAALASLLRAAAESLDPAPLPSARIVPLEALRRRRRSREVCCCGWRLPERHSDPCAWCPEHGWL